MSKELDYLSKRVARGLMGRRAFMGRAAALGVSASMAATYMANAAAHVSPVRGGTLKAGIQGGSSADSLDPALFAVTVMQLFGATWGDTLLEVSPSGEILNRLAESVEASADAKTWTFTIRQGVEFHNGKTVTPDDVVATIARHSDENSNSGALGIVKGIENMAVDGNNVVLTLASPNADFPYLMADYHIIIQPDGGVDAPDAGIGTGPYRIAEHQPGVRHVGQRFENYWDAANRGHADTIEVIALNDPTARLAALQSGQVHMIDRIEPKVVNLVQRIPGVTIQSVAGRGHYVFIMHTNTAPFDNNDLRMALKYAINRVEMVDKILQGFGSVGNDFPINASYPFFSDDIEQRVYDPDKAAFHYKKSGHEGTILLRTSDVAFPGAVDAAQLFEQSAAAAGITLEIKREPGDGYWSEVWNAQPFCASYWGGRPVQDQMYSTAYLTDAAWNDTRFFNDDFDNIIIAARAELDDVKRKAMYREAAVLVRDTGGLILPMFNNFIDATGPQVGGWVANPNGGMMANYALSKCWLLA
jgi:peptide/nickel transport system substrate-binding protein